jgi:hypothetical protein
MALDTPTVSQLSQVITRVTCVLVGCGCVVHLGVDRADELQFRQVTGVARDW